MKHRSNSARVALFALLAMTHSMPALAQAQRDRRAAHVETPAQVLAAANADARQRPTRGAFAEARHIYAYQEGALYELYANPNFISTLLLEPGETLIEIAAGDTSRWMVSETISETEREARALVLIKPQALNLRTNVVLITDRRTYLIEAISQAGEGYSAQVAWTYPTSQQSQASPASSVIESGYRVRTTRGRPPAWTPTRVFDDGQRTWVEFPHVTSSLDLPPLFVVSAEGAEIVNYRVEAGPEGPRYLIDRLFDVAELRLGARSPTIVRIERISALPARSSRRSGPRP